MIPDEDPFFQGRALARAKAQRLADAATPQRTPQPPQQQPASQQQPSSHQPPASPRQAPRPPSPEASGRMADVTAKPIVRREARAEGFLRLKATTLAALDAGTAPKGDPFPAARIAGILAAKNTPSLIPLCHPIPLTSVEVELRREERGVRATATVIAEWKTGVEMEALAAVTAALLTVWDMTKALEKDDTGNYPDTAIESVRVLSKTKGAAR